MITASDFQILSTLAGASSFVLWSLKQATGRWQEESDFIADTQGNYVAILSAIPHGHRWYSIGFSRNSVCYSKVRVFQNNDHKEYEQIQSVSVSVDIKGQGYSFSSKRAKSDLDDSNGYCILHPCGNSGDYIYPGTITSQKMDQTFHADPISPGSLSIYNINENKIYFEHADVVLSGNSGPFYYADGSGGKCWTESDACSYSFVNDAHFSFSKYVLPGVQCDGIHTEGYVHLY